MCIHIQVRRGEGGFLGVPETLLKFEPADDYDDIQKMMCVYDVTNSTVYFDVCTILIIVL